MLQAAPTQKLQDVTALRQSCFKPPTVVGQRLPTGNTQQPDKTSMLRACERDQLCSRKSLVIEREGRSYELQATNDKSHLIRQLLSGKEVETVVTGR